MLGLKLNHVSKRGPCCLKLTIFKTGPATADNGLQYRTPQYGQQLTHSGRGKVATMSQTTFWSAFSWIKIYKFRLKFHWNLFLGVQLTIFQHWFGLLSEPTLVSLLTHIYASLCLKELKSSKHLQNVEVKIYVRYIFEVRGKKFWTAKWLPRWYKKTR